MLGPASRMDTSATPMQQSRAHKVGPVAKAGPQEGGVGAGWCYFEPSRKLGHRRPVEATARGASGGRGAATPLTQTHKKLYKGTRVQASATRLGMCLLQVRASDCCREGLQGLETQRCGQVPCVREAPLCTPGPSAGGAITGSACIKDSNPGANRRPASHKRASGDPRVHVQPRPSSPTNDLPSWGFFFSVATPYQTKLPIVPSLVGKFLLR
jgi:hypothetical protein